MRFYGKLFSYLLLISFLVTSCASSPTKTTARKPSGQPTSVKSQVSPGIQVWVQTKLPTAEEIWLKPAVASKTSNRDGLKPLLPCTFILKAITYDPVGKPIRKYHRWVYSQGDAAVISVSSKEGAIVTVVSPSGSSEVNILPMFPSQQPDASIVSIEIKKPGTATVRVTVDDFSKVIDAVAIETPEDRGECRLHIQQ